MSTQKANSQQAQEATSTISKDTNQVVSKSGITYMFGKKNYQLMLAGLALIALGFILMAGGKSTDPHVFNKEEIYSFRRITLAPILVMAGFVLEIFAIMYLPKSSKEA